MAAANLPPAPTSISLSSPPPPLPPRAPDDLPVPRGVVIAAGAATLLLALLLLVHILARRRNLRQQRRAIRHGSVGCEHATGGPTETFSTSLSWAEYADWGAHDDEAPADACCEARSDNIVKAGVREDEALGTWWQQTSSAWQSSWDHLVRTVSGCVAPSVGSGRVAASHLADPLVDSADLARGANLAADAHTAARLPGPVGLTQAEVDDAEPHSVQRLPDALSSTSTSRPRCSTGDAVA